MALSVEVGLGAGHIVNRYDAMDRSTWKKLIRLDDDQGGGWMNISSSSGSSSSSVAYRPLVELVALFAFAIRCRGLHTADINVFIGRTTNFSHPRVRFLRDHFSTQGRLA